MREAQKMQKDIKNRNWYNFNLLSLSEAKIVTIKNRGNNKDYIFAGYDTCTTHGERGVYNFSPVRDKDNNVLGYSYTNETSVEYPYDEFPANDEIANLVQYVGRRLSDVLASPKETKQFINGEHNEKLNSKLYKIVDIFSPEEIKAQKMNLRGDYVDSTKTLFFRENELGKVIFPYTDCEGSGKPSVLPMWGCCFSVINAIKRDIDYERRAPILFEHYGNYGAYLDKKERVMSGILNKAREAKKWGNYREAEARYNEAIEASKISEKYGDPDITPYLELGDMFLDLKEYRKASGCLNTAMFYLCKKLAFTLEGTTSSKTIADVKQNKANLKIYQNYLNELRDYYKLNSFLRFFATKPTTHIPTDSNSVDNYEYSIKLYNNIQEIAEIYKKIGITCENNNETDSAKKCYQASKEIANCTELGNKLILRRADHNRYIGDLIK